MRRFIIPILLSFISSVFINNSICAQNSYEIVRELEKTIVNYNASPFGASWWKVQNATINYNAPLLTLKITTEDNSSGGGHVYTRYLTYKFDVLKAHYRIDPFPYNGKPTFEISCSTGIDVIEQSYHVDPMFGRQYEGEKTSLPQKVSLICSSSAITSRLLNAFNNLQTLAKEDNIKKSSPHIFDDSELIVQKIDFVAPDNSGKLKANQTGCFKIEVKNTTTNNAFNVACVVKEKNKSELFSYEQYTSIEKISGNNTEVINIPIKASENVDNGKYPFEIMITYNGKTIKTETLNITTSNPKKQQSVSSASGGARNKTIRMRKMAGNTYLISCKVNGLPLDFIFDTGASSVTLSRKQAVFMLKNGYLSKSDIVGSSAYQTASGDIAIGTVIKLMKIEINGLVLNNVEASIINSDSAPLLLGQSALSRLGKIQIDYNNSTLTIIR